MAFVSTSTEIALIDSRTTAGSITLPLTTQIGGRILTFKDQYGAANLSAISLVVQGGDLFEDGSVAKTIAQAYGNLTIFASTNRWYITGGTTQDSFTADLLTVSSIQTYNWLSLNSNYAQNSVQVPAAVGQIALLDNIFTSTTAGTASSFIEFGNLNPLQTSATGSNAFRYLVGVERNFTSASNGIDFKIKRWNSFGTSVRPYGANNSTLQDAVVVNFLGNVGIGTNNPSTLLDVAGTGRATLISSLNNNVSSIGVATNWPLYRLDVNGAAQLSTLLFPFTGATLGRKIVFAASGAANNFNQNYTGFGLNGATEFRASVDLANTVFTWGTTAASGLFTEWARLSNARMGINVTNPQYTLDVNGNCLLSSLVLATNPTNPVVSTSIYRLSVMGDAQKMGANTWATPSDQRIKENIVDADLSRCYNDVKQLKLRRFNYISSFQDNFQIYDKTVLGYIAQEVCNVIPKTVRPDTFCGYPDFLSFTGEQVNYAHFGALQRVIQDKEVLESTTLSLQTLNDDLTARISTLESYVSGIRGGNV